MFFIVFGCIYFGFRPLLQHSTSGMSREIVLGLLGAGLVATITGVLLAFERHLDTSNRLKENRFDSILKEYGSFNTQFFSMIADETITRDEISKLKEILFRIYLVGYPSSYSNLEKLVKEIDEYFSDKERQENGEVDVKNFYLDWTEKLEEIIKFQFRNDLKFEVETKFKKLIEAVKAKRSVAPIAKKSGFKNNEEKKETLRGRDKTKYMLGSETNLTKSDYVKKLFFINFKDKNIPYEDFEDIFKPQEKDGDEFWDNTLKSQAYKSSDPYWLPLEMARAKEKKYQEAKGKDSVWKRYFIKDKNDILKFDDVEVAIRSGQSIDSVEALEKLFIKRKLIIGKKFNPK